MNGSHRSFVNNFHMLVKTEHTPGVIRKISIFSLYDNDVYEYKSQNQIEP